MYGIQCPDRTSFWFFTPWIRSQDQNFGHRIQMTMTASQSDLKRASSMSLSGHCFDFDLKPLHRLILCMGVNIWDDLGLDIIRANIVVKSTSHDGSCCFGTTCWWDWKCPFLSAWFWGYPLIYYCIFLYPYIQSSTLFPKTSLFPYAKLDDVAQRRAHMLKTTRWVHLVEMDRLK